jgi:hypothetical protein
MLRHRAIAKAPREKRSHEPAEILKAVWSGIGRCWLERRQGAFPEPFCASLGVCPRSIAGLRLSQTVVSRAWPVFDIGRGQSR